MNLSLQLPRHISNDIHYIIGAELTNFKNTFRIESARMKEWDYASPWWYYVTINTMNHNDYFGKVVKEIMLMNDLGRIVDDCWKNIPKHFPNVELDYYVIMPNHIHGIIIINPVVETPYMASLPLGDIIGKFKAAVKRWANKNGCNNFAWQPRFYDRIIRNEKELINIRKYIDLNPLKWELKKAKQENICEM